jgi:hypothetical protein
MSDFTTDRAARLDELRGAILAAAAADLEGVGAERPAAGPGRSAAAAPRTARPPRRLHFGTARARLALAFLVLVVAVPGIVLGSGLVGTDRAAANGLPGGSTTLTSIQPDCTAIRVGVEYECAFAESPRVGRVVRTVDSSGRVDGGCLSQNRIETYWICYFGGAAVHHQVVASAVL